MGNNTSSKSMSFEDMAEELEAAELTAVPVETVVEGSPISEPDVTNVGVELDNMKGE